VVIRPLGLDFSANAQVATAIHEAAHALLSLARQDDDPKLSYAEEEVVAECVAYLAGQALGLDTSVNSTPYLASWGEGEQIERYAALIDRLASRIEAVLIGAGETRPPAAHTESAGSLALAPAEAPEPPSLLAQAA
jgi:antirestriction protein ArdC